MWRKWKFWSETFGFILLLIFQYSIPCVAIYQFLLKDRITSSGFIGNHGFESMSDISIRFKEANDKERIIVWMWTNPHYLLINGIHFQESSRRAAKDIKQSRRHRHSSKTESKAIRKEWSISTTTRGRIKPGFKGSDVVGIPKETCDIV